MLNSRSNKELAERMTVGARDGNEEAASVASCTLTWASYVKGIIILGLTAVTAYQTAISVLNYYQRDVVTSLVKDLYTNVTFPSVTICNYNRWRKSKVINTEAQMQVIAAYQKLHSGTTSGASMPSGNGSRLVSAPLDIYNLTLDAGWYLVDEQNEASLPQYGNRTLLKCTFGSLTCNTQFFLHRMTTYGNCFTFNYDVNSSDIPSDATVPDSLPLLQTHASAKSGLSLLIDIDVDEYYEVMETDGTELFGLKVLVHPQYEAPDPSTEGFPVSPGTHVFAALTKTEYSNLEPPYGSCNSSLTLSSSQRYTASGCEAECKMMEVDKNCSCRPFYFPASPAYNSCDAVVTLMCANVVVDTIDTEFNRYCKCPNPCNYEEYSYELSYASRPSRNIGAEMAAYYQMAPVRYNKSVVSLTVYMKEIGQTTISQSQATTVDSVLSDFGGIIGLFLGVSCLTVVELFDTLHPYVAAYVRRRRPATADSSVKPPIPSDPWKRGSYSSDVYRLQRRRSLVSPVPVKQAFA